MSNKRLLGAIAGSFLIFIVGLFRILFESVASTPLFVAYDHGTYWSNSKRYGTWKVQV